MNTSVDTPNDVTTYTHDAASDQLTSAIGADKASAATTSICFDARGDMTAEVAPDTSLPRFSKLRWSS